MTTFYDIRFRGVNERPHETFQGFSKGFLPSMVPKGAGRTRGAGKFPFHEASPFPKNPSGRGMKERKSKKKSEQKSRMEAQSQDFPPLTTVPSNTERRAPNRYG